MREFSASRAVQVAEAVVRSERAAVVGAPTGSRKPKPPPADVTLHNRPISAAILAPRWTFLMLWAAAPLWLQIACWCIAGAFALGAITGVLTIIGLAMMLSGR